MLRHSVTDKLQKKSRFVQVASVLITAFLFCVLFCGCSEDGRNTQDTGSSSTRVANNAISKPSKVPADQNLTEGSVSATSNLKAAQKVWKELLEAMRNRDEDGMAQRTTQNGFSYLMGRANKESPLDELAKWGNDWQESEPRWYALDSSDEVVLNIGPQVKEYTFYFKKTPSGWKMDQWYLGR